ncbi:MAG: metallophosphoesterase family protein [Acidobacteriota bacterium]
MVSDTHGMLRPELMALLGGCDRILHAGDIGSRAVLDGLRGIAPVTAIRGNIDREPWARELMHTEAVEVAGVRFYLVHDLAALALDPVSAGFGVVVSGHSHRPSVRRLDGTLYVNPGSAGPRRFTLPVTAAVAEVRGGEVKTAIVDLVGAG